MKFDESDFEWLEVGNYIPDLSPRLFVERLGFTDWNQACSHVVRPEDEPWWWFYEDLREKAKQYFNDLVSDQGHF